jgi:hypothetical protein
MLRQEEGYTSISVLASLSPEFLDRFFYRSDCFRRVWKWDSGPSRRAGGRHSSSCEAARHLADRSPAHHGLGHCRVTLVVPGRQRASHHPPSRNHREPHLGQEPSVRWCGRSARTATPSQTRSQRLCPVRGFGGIGRIRPVRGDRAYPGPAGPRDGVGAPMGRWWADAGPSRPGAHRGTHRQNAPRGPCPPVLDLAPGSTPGAFQARIRAARLVCSTRAPRLNWGFLAHPAGFEPAALGWP